MKEKLKGLKKPNESQGTYPVNIVVYNAVRLFFFSMGKSKKNRVGNIRQNMRFLGSGYDFFIINSPPPS